MTARLPHDRHLATKARGAALIMLVFALGEVVWPAPAGADIPGIGIVTGPINSLLGAGAGWAFDKVAEGIAHWVLDAVAFFVGGAIQFLTTSARPDVEAAWFAGAGSPYATVRNIAGLLLIGFVFLGVLQGLLAGDAAGMIRRVAGNLPAAIAGMVLTTAIAARLLELTDVLSDAVLASSDQQAMHFLSGFGVASSFPTGFATVLLGLVAVLAALLLWVELIVRASLIYLLIAVSPLGFAATLWPAAKGMLRRTIELLLAVILSKLFIAITLAIGVAALAGAGTTAPGGSAADQATAGLGALLVGAVLLGLAAFSPFLVLKLIPIAEAAVVAHGISRGPLRAGQTAAVGLNNTRSLARLSGSSASSSRSAAPNAPTGAAATTSSSGATAAAAGPAAGMAAAAVVAKGTQEKVAAKVTDPVVAASNTNDAPRSASQPSPQAQRTPRVERGDG